MHLINVFALFCNGYAFYISIEPANELKLSFTRYSVTHCYIQPDTKEFFVRYCLIKIIDRYQFAQFCTNRSRIFQYHLPLLKNTLF